MDIFIAGATGTIGIPLVRALVAAGHRVTAQTRSPEKVELVRALGAVPALRVIRNPDKLAFIDRQLAREPQNTRNTQNP